MVGSTELLFPYLHVSAHTHTHTHACTHMHTYEHMPAYRIHAQNMHTHRQQQCAVFVFDTQRVGRTQMSVGSWMEADGAQKEPAASAARCSDGGERKGRPWAMQRACPGQGFTRSPSRSTPGTHCPNALGRDARGRVHSYCPSPQQGQPPGAPGSACLPL